MKPKFLARGFLLLALLLATGLGGRASGAAPLPDGRINGRTAPRTASLPPQPAAAPPASTATPAATMPITSTFMGWDTHGFPDGLQSNGSIDVIAKAPNGELYVGGDFSAIGGVPAPGIARWDGQRWHSLVPAGERPRIYAMAWHNGALYAGGQFATIGGVPAKSLARWDGQSWAAVGGGAFDFLDGHEVRALVSYRGQLYIGGNFDVDRSPLVRWDGAHVTPLNLTVSWGRLFASIEEILVDGPTFYIRNSWMLASWNAETGEPQYLSQPWQTSLTGMATVNGKLYVSTQSGSAQHAAVQWVDNGYLSELGESWDNAGHIEVTVESGVLTAVVQDATSSRVYRWLNGAWAAAATLPARPRAVLATPAGIYVGFEHAGISLAILHGPTVTAIATTTATLDRVDRITIGGQRTYIAMANDGTSTLLMAEQAGAWRDITPVLAVKPDIAADATGALYAIPYTAAHTLLRYDGAAWASLVAPLTKTSSLHIAKTSIVIFGDSIPLDDYYLKFKFARWDGAAWTQWDSPLLTTDSRIGQIAVSDDRVAVVTSQWEAPDNSSHHLKVWDGTQWTELAETWDLSLINLIGVEGTDVIALFRDYEQWLPPQVRVYHADGVSAQPLTIDGVFLYPIIWRDGMLYFLYKWNGAAVLARWDGQRWESSGQGVNGAINGVALAPDGSVYVVGDFTTAGGQPSRTIAAWRPYVATEHVFGPLLSR